MKLDKVSVEKVRKFFGKYFKIIDTDEFVIELENKDGDKFQITSEVGRNLCYLEVELYIKNKED